MSFFKRTCMALLPCLMVACGVAQQQNHLNARTTIKPNETYSYRGFDSLFKQCTLTVSSDRSGNISRIKWHANVLMDGIVVPGQGKYEERDTDIVLAEEFKGWDMETTGFSVTDGLRIYGEQPLPSGVSGEKNTVSFIFKGSSLGSLTAFDVTGGSSALTSSSFCHGLSRL